MLTRWLPWRYIVKYAARKMGFIDPVGLLARLRRFAQPSEVQEPIELLRAGIVFHARGLVNTRAIQHNLDWIWPYWVERQFNPGDPSFIPRGFSFSHVNLTHRNWTAAARPDLPVYPLVGPRGLVTPLFDGWSLDFWIVSKNGDCLFPSKLSKARQKLVLEPELLIRTECEHKGMDLVSEVKTVETGDGPFLQAGLSAHSLTPAYLAVVLRPFNPEGIQFIEKIRWLEHETGWLINGRDRVGLSRRPDRIAFSDYRRGDVADFLNENNERTEVSCKVGLATAAALYRLDPEAGLEVSVPLMDELGKARPQIKPGDYVPGPDWDEAVKGTAGLDAPDDRFVFLYDSAVRTLIMLSAGEVVPGPYTYRRFWFRDACLMMNSMLAAGLADRCERALARFPDRQKRSGYFRSQEGEWDSNGQVLWIADRFRRLTGRGLDKDLVRALFKGAEWIIGKRVSPDSGQRHAGLLPAGFSAEHLGPNDYYYWDDFWSVAGLECAARLAGEYGRKDLKNRFSQQALDLKQAIFKSIQGIPEKKSRGGMPASPYRRLDAGAVGSLVADYPLALTEPGDAKVMNTVSFLMDACFHEGGFFQDMIHSGINAYLTLDIAQTLLRAGDARFRDLVETVAGLASPTGQWPEAIHPFTGGGCMGDGQHAWAAAEWVMIMRNMFVREEPGGLVIGSGLFPEWIKSDKGACFGPTPTPYGEVTVRLDKTAQGPRLEVDARWRGPAPRLEIRPPGYAAEPDDSRAYAYILAPKES